LEEVIAVADGIIDTAEDEGIVGGDTMRQTPGS